jgi:hypothetical protein
MTVRPARSVRSAPGGTAIRRRGPTAWMRPSRTRMTPSSTGSAPPPSRIRTPTKAWVAGSAGAASSAAKMSPAVVMVPPSPIAALRVDRRRAGD